MNVVNHEKGNWRCNYHTEIFNINGVEIGVLWKEIARERENFFTKKWNYESADVYCREAAASPSLVFTGVMENVMILLKGVPHTHGSILLFCSSHE